MNPPANPLLLLSAVIAVAMLAVWWLARRRRARDIVERMNDQLAAAAIHVPDHVRPPTIIATPPDVFGSAGAAGPGGAVRTVGTVGTVATIDTVGPASSAATVGAASPIDTVGPAGADDTASEAGPVDTVRPAGTAGGRTAEAEHAHLSADGGVATSLIPTATNDVFRNLTDMLEGIKLPYDLMPVPSVVEDPDRHIIFLTTHSNAGEVGKRFADELERLGFELESVDFDQAVAVRGDDVVSMKIVPDAGRVEVGGRPRYGAAGSGDVALETWIGRSPVPPSASAGALVERRG